MRRLGLLFLTILTGDRGDQTQHTGFRKRRQSPGPFKRWQIQRQQAAHEDPLTAAQKAGNDAPTGTGRVSPVEKTLGSVKKRGPLMCQNFWRARWPGARQPSDNKFIRDPTGQLKLDSQKSFCVVGMLCSGCAKRSWRFDCSCRAVLKVLCLNDLTPTD
jgi:hypothetical protein